MAYLIPSLVAVDQDKDGVVSIMVLELIVLFYLHSLPYDSFLIFPYELFFFRMDINLILNDSFHFGGMTLFECRLLDDNFQFEGMTVFEIQLIQVLLAEPALSEFHYSHPVNLLQDPKEVFDHLYRALP